MNTLSNYVVQKPIIIIFFCAKVRYEYDLETLTHHKKKNYADIVILNFLPKIQFEKSNTADDVIYACHRSMNDVASCSTDYRYA